MPMAVEHLGNAGVNRPSVAHIDVLGFTASAPSERSLKLEIARQCHYVFPLNHADRVVHIANSATIVDFVELSHNTGGEHREIVAELRHIGYESLQFVQVVSGVFLAE